MGDLQRLGRQRRYFFSLNRYLFVATKRSRSTPADPTAP
jgi:hypothetical protein